MPDVVMPSGNATLDGTSDCRCNRALLQGSDAGHRVCSLRASTATSGLAAAWHVLAVSCHALTCTNKPPPTCAGCRWQTALMAEQKANGGVMFIRGDALPPGDVKSAGIVNPNHSPFSIAGHVVVVTKVRTVRMGGAEKRERGLSERTVSSAPISDQPGLGSWPVNCRPATVCQRFGAVAACETRAAHER
eukprot:131158-Chlamydomonas_euryale.AAC.1